MSDIEEIARINRDLWAGKQLYAITVDGGWFTVHEHSAGGVAPEIEYATPQEAVARLMQLMGIKTPVAPQDWPERV
jgi:hypothetical protein